MYHIQFTVELGVKRNLVVDLDEYCNHVKASYPEISARADVEYDKTWNTFIKMEFSSYSWFESLAVALNKEMTKKIDPIKYKGLFAEIGREFSVAEHEVRNAIDVSFVENLFWQVSEKDSENYWEVLPENLKALYLDFHRRLPF